MSLVARAASALSLRWLAGPRRAGRAFDPARFGIEVEDPACRVRSEGILDAFFSGFETGLEAGPDGIRQAASVREPLFQPFFHEGAAMAFIPRGYFRFAAGGRSLAEFARSRDPRSPFSILEWIGVGFWLGFLQPRRPERFEVLATRAPLRFRHLLHDGYGFKLGFFDLARADARWRCARARAGGEAAPGVLLDAPPLRSILALAGFGRESALNGLGRSLWFFAMDRPQCGFEAARLLGGARLPVLGGMGLAAAYTFPDDLDIAYRTAAMLTGDEARAFAKGVRIALYARAENGLDLLRTWMAALPADTRSRAEKDLELALEAGRKTRERDDFVEAFHAACAGEG